MKTVPCWMVLDWVSQLTALIDKPVSRAVHDLLLTLAQQYPQALVYPFRMSDDGFAFSDNAEGRTQKSFRNKFVTNFRCEILPTYLLLFVNCVI